MSLLTIPAGLIFQLNAYPINNPIWSIFFELVANMIYATKVRKLSKSLVTSFLFLASSILLVASIQFGTIGALGFLGPWSFLSGFVRVAVPFTIGVIIYRTKTYNKVYRLPFVLSGSLLIIALGLHFSVAWAYDVVTVLVIFPAIVCIGAMSSMRPSTKRFCDLSGRISYPLYIMHQPILRTLDALYKTIHPQIGPVLLMIFGVVVAFIVSALLLKFYDEPVRAWLTQATRGVPEQPMDAALGSAVARQAEAEAKR